MCMHNQNITDNLTTIIRDLEKLLVKQLPDLQDKFVGPAEYYYSSLWDLALIFAMSQVLSATLGEYIHIKTSYILNNYFSFLFCKQQ